MVSAWYMDNSDEDQRLPHKTTNEESVSIEQLAKLGVLYWKITPEKFPNDPEVQKIREERGYNFEDTIEIHKDTLPNYEDKLKIFYTEHLHTDEEIRYILAGIGYFDVRDTNEKWIRILCEPGDLLILPAGIYHRFTLDTTNYIKAARYFVGEPVWTPHNRPADELEPRREYVKQFIAAH